MGESNEVYNLGDGKVRAESRVVLVGEKKKKSGACGGRDFKSLSWRRNNMILCPLLSTTSASS